MKDGPERGPIRRALGPSRPVLWARIIWKAGQNIDCGWGDGLVSELIVRQEWGSEIRAQQGMTASK